MREIKLVRRVLPETQPLNQLVKGEGVKYDQGKLRYSLMPLGTINKVLQVLDYGARKYEENNWMKVPHGRHRYFDATMRHIDAWWKGESLDPESGLPHLAHAATCLLFLLFLEGR